MGQHPRAPAVTLEVGYTDDSSTVSCLQMPHHPHVTVALQGGPGFWEANRQVAIDSDHVRDMVVFNNNGLLLF